MSAARAGRPEAGGPGAAPYPPAVTGWLTGGGRARVLDIATGRAGLAQMLAADGHEVICLDQRLVAMTELHTRLYRAGRLDADGAAQPSERLTPVVGQAESLPFADRCMDLVTVAESLHRFAPGLALAEAARVLRPGGSIAVVYNTRDDTVPWVKRLTRLVQQYDPSIMSGDYGHGSIAALDQSPYFGSLSRRHFRNWIPVTRPAMLAMVERNPSVARLPEAQRTELLDGVGRLYDESARAPEPLLLPFQATAWRAEVDHSQVRFSESEDDGLDISLRW